MNEELATIPYRRIEISREAESFELMQRQAKMLASSTLIPKEFQGNMANCAIGLNIAKRLGADPFMVLQNIDIIHGRPGFRASFLIAMVNASGRFAPLRFTMTGEGMEKKCVAFAEDRASKEIIEGPEVSMKMAKDEGWYEKNGSKWKTMPDLMLRYRAGAFFARIYAPDITLGMQTAEELRDVETKFESARLVSSPIDPSKKTPFDAPQEAIEIKDESEPNLEQTPQTRLLQSLADSDIKEAAFMKAAGLHGKMISSLTDEQVYELVAEFSEITEKIK